MLRCLEVCRGRIMREILGVSLDLLQMYISDSIVYYMSFVNSAPIQ